MFLRDLEPLCSIMVMLVKFRSTFLGKVWLVYIKEKSTFLAYRNSKRKLQYILSNFTSAWLFIFFKLFIGDLQYCRWGFWHAATDEGNITFATGSELQAACTAQFEMYSELFYSLKCMHVCWIQTAKGLLKLWLKNCFIYLNFISVFFFFFFFAYVSAVSLDEGTMTFCDFITVTWYLIS